MRSRLRTAFAPAVRDALAAGRPVVALESSIISQGMPYPQNLEVARQVEDVVRAHGATPATIAIIRGVPTFGVEGDDLVLLGQSPDVTKASRRDVAYVVASGATAATTVASTMLLCHHAGIKVFATGGIGGVHRGAAETFDISADLVELGRTPVTVVCSGVKSILDIAKTLEVLETEGVAVVGWGCEGGAFPSFFTNSSGGLRAPLNVDGSEEGDGARTVAAMMRTSAALGMEGGIVVAAPNPQPADAATLAGAIDAAVAEAAAAGVGGAKVTPFVLGAVAKATGGSSLEANIALVMNNAAVASRIAVEHARAERDAARSGAKRAVVIGGAALDTHLSPRDGIVLERATSNPGAMTQSPGGVGLNIACGLARLVAAEGGKAPAMVTTVGDDAAGAALRAHLARVGVDDAHVAASPSGLPTASYTAIVDERGELDIAIAAMDVLGEISAHDALSAYASPATGFAVVDGNVAPGVLTALAKARAASSAPLWFEPTSVSKSTLPIESAALGAIDVVSPNLLELVAMVAALPAAQGSGAGAAALREALDALDAVGRAGVAADSAVRVGELERHVVTLGAALWEAMSAGAETHPASPLLHGKHIVCTLGAEGVLWMTEEEALATLSPSSQLRRVAPSSASGGVAGVWLPSEAVDRSVLRDSTGCGDAFVAGSVHGLVGGAGAGAAHELAAFLRGIECARGALLRSGA